jgi:hypothetical protein
VARTGAKEAPVKAKAIAAVHAEPSSAPVMASAPVAPRGNPPPLPAPIASFNF